MIVRKSLKPFAAVGVILLAPLVCMPLSPEYGAPLSVLVTIILLWFGELLPLPVTALLVPVLTTLYRVLPAQQAFQPFGSEIIFLFLGCFFLTRAMQKHGWDKRMAFFVLSRNFANGSPSRLILLMAACAYALGMWVSNTATTAIMIAVGLGVVHALKEHFSTEKMWERFALRMLLACAFSASIGGLSTPVGTPPNLIVLGFLEQYGLEISFFGWMSKGVPVSLVILTLVLAYLELHLPLRHEKLPDLQPYFQKELLSLGKLKSSEIQVATVFLLMVVMWVLPGIVAILMPDSPAAQAFKDTFTIAIVGLTGALLLFILPHRDNGLQESNLTWKDAKHIDWGILMLFGGGLSLGNMLEQSGLALHIGEQAFSQGVHSIALIVLAALFLSVVMSEFTSSTAAASILVPVLVPTFLSTLALPPEIVLPLVMACAFAINLGFMLPVSTPPNALIFGTGLVPLKSLIRAGLVLDLIGITIVFVWVMLTLNLM